MCCILDLIIIACLSEYDLIWSGEVTRISASVLVLLPSKSSSMSSILAFSTIFGIEELSIVLSMTTPLTSCMSVTLPCFSSILMSSTSMWLPGRSAMLQTASTTRSIALSPAYDRAFDWRHVLASLFMTCLSELLQAREMSCNASRAMSSPFR